MESNDVVRVKDQITNSDVSKLNRYYMFCVGKMQHQNKKSNGFFCNYEYFFSGMRLSSHAFYHETKYEEKSVTNFRCYQTDINSK